MKLEDVKVGLKVVPHTKSGGFTSSIKRWTDSRGDEINFLKDGYLTVEGITFDGEEDVVILAGDYFKAEDFEPYVEPKLGLSEDGNTYTVNIPFTPITQPQSSRKSFSVPILGESYEVIVVETTEHLKNEMGEEEFELYFGDTSAVGMCISPENKIYICENSAVTQEDVDKMRGIHKKPTCDHCGHTNEEEEEEEFFILPLSTKEKKKTVLHELVHATMSGLTRDDLSSNEDLVDIIAEVMYRAYEVDQSPQKIFKEMGL